MRETDLLHHIRDAASRLLAAHPDVLVGPGDDCALVRVGSQSLLLKVDQVIQGRHYAPDTPLDLVARKAIARTVSDLAAMGGIPRFALVSAALPSNFPQAHATLLADALHRWGLHFGCPVVGGDVGTTNTPADPLVLSVSILGEPPARGPALRSHARAGDTLCVTGAIGHSFASGRHLTFTPRVEESRWLVTTLGEALGAMIDVSDGLGLDASRIAQASGVRLEIDADRIPLHPDAGPVSKAVTQGEDYELLFTVRPGCPIPETCPTTGTPITPIGRCLEGSGAFLIEGETTTDLSKSGWEHT